MTGLLVLARPSFLVLGPLFVVLFAVRPGFPWKRSAAGMLLFACCLCTTILPWSVRNYVSVGKFGLTEEYGSQQIIERFGYNSTTLAEGLAAFPAALPQVGRDLTGAVLGEDVLHRMSWGPDDDTFYHVGVAHRWELIKLTSGHVDSVIWPIISQEMRENWWRHALTTLPIAWTGMWVGQTWGLTLVPIFLFMLIAAIRQRRTLFIMYAAPAMVMVLVHGAAANQNVRYNFGLIGPISVAAVSFAFLAMRRRQLSPGAFSGTAAAGFPRENATTSQR